MCPLWPLQWVLLYFLMLCPMWLVTCQAVKAAADWSVLFTPEELLNLKEGETQTVSFKTYDVLPSDVQKGFVDVVVEDPNIAYVSNGSEFTLKTEPIDTQGGLHWTSAFKLTGNFLGYTSVKLRLKYENGNESTPYKESNPLKVTVVRDRSLLDKAFTTSVVVLVFIIFITFGCALDLAMLKRAIVRPIGPVIGLLAHFLIMPLASWALGMLLFKDSVALRLGLFFTGISPAGGASNVWTVTLGGNLNLSVTMTAVSTLASLLMIPVWVLTLGRSIFPSDSVGIPYYRIARSSITLFVPLALGYGMQVYFKKAAKLMVRILKPLSVLLIIFIIIFAIITNLYVFKLFTWQILLGGLLIPVTGYICGWIMSCILNQSTEDVIAIAVETGVQNTGIAIFLLQFCLGQPEADLTTVAPVAVALMTPVPLLLLYLVRRLRGDIIQPVKLPIDDQESFTSSSGNKA